MKKHQRYFPVINADGSLTNHFIVVRNGDQEFAETVVDGNLQVVHARFADANSLSARIWKRNWQTLSLSLKKRTFQKELGSMLAKTRRIQKLSNQLGAKLGAQSGRSEDCRPRSELCKADLASQMVVEMTSLQGIMGAARREIRETPDVAQGVFERLFPARWKTSRLPEGWAGVCVGLADRLDRGTVRGWFGADGNKDLCLAPNRAGLGTTLDGKANQ